jgi:hypothetical protein
VDHAGSLGKATGFVSKQSQGFSLAVWNWKNIAFAAEMENARMGKMYLWKSYYRPYTNAQSTNVDADQGRTVA